MGEYQWYLMRDGERYGPVGEGEMRRWVGEGRVVPWDMVWREGLPEWVAAGGEWGFYAGGGGGGWEGSWAGDAGFWKRFAAMWIDFFVTLAPLMLVRICIDLFGLTGGMSAEMVDGFHSVVSFVLSGFYYALMECSSAQGTVGKLALGIKVVDEFGGRLSFGRAMGRYWAKLVWYVTFGIGGLMIGFTNRKQGLHDMLAGCYVVNRGD